jgi:hypothetical protein
MRPRRRSTHGYVGERLRRHHPHMTVWVGKRTRVAPRLLSGLRDDLATCLVRTLYQLVNVGLGLSTQG